MNQMERKQKIMEELTANGNVSIVGLTASLGVSSMTIRRDLTRLSQEGLITLDRGGAFLNSGALFEYSIPMKRGVKIQEKTRIAAKCVEYIHDGDSIFLDGGTTVAAVARLLPARKGIVAVTNSFLAASYLSGSSQSRIIMCPGEYRKTSMAYIGPLTDEFITRFKIDTLFLGIEGIDLSKGLTVPDTLDGCTKRALIRSAQRVICAADSSKVGLTFLYQVCPLSCIDILITDTGLSDEAAEKFLQQDIEVIRV